MFDSLVFRAHVPGNRTDKAESMDSKVAAVRTHLAQDP